MFPQSCRLTSQVGSGCRALPCPQLGLLPWPHWGWTSRSSQKHHYRSGVCTEVTHHPMLPTVSRYLTPQCWLRTGTVPGRGRPGRCNGTPRPPHGHPPAVGHPRGTARFTSHLRAGSDRLLWSSSLGALSCPPQERPCRAGTVAGLPTPPALPQGSGDAAAAQGTAGHGAGCPHLQACSTWPHQGWLQGSVRAAGPQHGGQCRAPCPTATCMAGRRRCPWHQR